MFSPRKKRDFMGVLPAFISTRREESIEL